MKTWSAWMIRPGRDRRKDGMSSGVEIATDVPVSMRDGVVLRTDVYRPRGDGRRPGLLLRIPYNKTLARSYVYAHPIWYARHGFVVGTPGSGKTNTALHLCRQLWSDHRIPFLVVEPVNAELDDYRWLATLPGFDDLVVLTVGDESVVGANSLVNRDVPPRCTVLGVPAKVVGRKGSEDYLEV